MAYPGRSASSARYRAARSVLDCGGRAQRRHRFGVSERNGIGKSFVPIPNGAGGVRVSGDSPACFGVFPPSAPIRVHLRFIIPLCFAFSVFFAVKSVSAFSLSRVPRVSRFKNSPPRFAVSPAPAVFMTVRTVFDISVPRGGGAAPVPRKTSQARNHDKASRRRNGVLPRPPRGGDSLSPLLPFASPLPQAVEEICGILKNVPGSFRIFQPEKMQAFLSAQARPVRHYSFFLPSRPQSSL